MPITETEHGEASASPFFCLLFALFVTLSTRANSIPEGLSDMCLSSSQIKAIRQEAGNLHGAAQAWLSGWRENNMQRGFTLVELIMTLVIVGILAVAAAPRFFDVNVFKSKGFADQLQAALRYAQKEAIAQRRYVCVALAASSITLTTGATAACGTNLALPEGGNSITAPSGVTLSSSPSSSFNFDALGRTALKQTITVSGATNSIVVEAETGYVHSP